MAKKAKKKKTNSHPAAPLTIWRAGDGVFKIPSHAPRGNYQSWCFAYPSYEKLLEASGVTDYRKEDAN